MHALELETDNELNEDIISNENIISEFTQELSKKLEEKDIFVYQRPIDNGEFTNENLEKLEKKYKQIITDFYNIQDIENSTICEVLEMGKNYDVVREYDKEMEKIVDMQVSKKELPKDCKIGMILRKEDDEYAIDKDMTQEMYYKMKEYETELTNEQEKYLKKMRKNGELYYVKNVERRLQVLEDRT